MRHLNPKIPAYPAMAKRSNYLDLQISCLAGGTILQVHSLDEARVAEAWGAVAIYFSDLDSLSDEELKRLVKEVSLHPLCSPKDFSRLSAAYKDRTLHHFARLPASNWGRPSRAFALAAGDAEITALFQRSTDKPSLILCETLSLLSVALVERKKANLSTLIFVEVQSLDDGVRALLSGANGILLQREAEQEMPSAQDQQDLMDAVIAAPTGEWPQNKRIIGVLAHQGDYLAHVAAFEEAIERLGVSERVAVKEVRTREDYHRCHAVSLTGGWSNLQTLFLKKTAIEPGLRSARGQGIPVLGTCAGMILCGSRGGEHTQGRLALGLVPGTVDNNAIDGPTWVKYASMDDATSRRTEEILFSNGPVLRDFSEDVEILTRVQETGQAVAASHGSTFVYSYHDYERTHSEFLKFCLTHWDAAV